MNDVLVELNQKDSEILAEPRRVWECGVGENGRGWFWMVGEVPVIEERVAEDLADGYDAGTGFDLDDVGAVGVKEDGVDSEGA